MKGWLKNGILLRHPFLLYKQIIISRVYNYEHCYLFVVQKKIN